MGTILQTEKTILDPTISLRFATWADLSAVTQLIYDVCEADGDTTVAVTEEEMTNEWKTPGFNIETDGIVAVTSDGRIVGYEEFFNEHEHSKLRTDGYVHPQFKGLGIATAMMHVVEERARKEIELAAPDARVYLHSTLDNHDESGKSVHESCGYSPIRYHWRMEIKLDHTPPLPNFPKGIELRPYDVKHDHALYKAHEDAFSDHWGYTPGTYDEWLHHNQHRDKSLWIIAWDGDQIAGYSLCRIRMEVGWVGSLGVLRPWRKQGLGEALLLQSFHNLYKLGHATIGLGVDAQNPTGATRLYKKAGMYPASEFVTYEKELRPGRSLE